MLDAAIEAILDPLACSNPVLADTTSNAFYIDTSLQPQDILHQGRRQFSSSTHKDVSLPSQTLAFSASSSPLTELLDFDDLSITESNVDFVKYDYICGVGIQLPLNGPFYPCLERLSCKNHTLGEKLEMLRSKPIERLMMREVSHKYMYEKRRETIMRVLHSKHASKRVIIQPAFRNPAIVKSIDESLVLGTEIPLIRDGSSLRKRKINEPLVSTGLGKKYRFSRSLSESLSGHTTLKNDTTVGNDSNDDTKDEELVLNTKEENTTYTGSNYTTSQSFGSSFGTTKSLDALQTRTVEFLKKLSAESGTRIVETMAYLHLKLNPISRYTVPTRAKKLRDKFRSSYFEN